MKRVKRFLDFYPLDFISESRVYFLNDLNRKLQDLAIDGNDWAYKLLKSQGKNIDSDTTFLNLDGENFSFSKENDIRKMYPDAAKELFSDEIDSNYPPLLIKYFGDHQQNFLNNLSGRNKVKMGKVIKKIIPEIPDKELEKLVNTLKAETSGFQITLVKGDDIKKYYNSESIDPKYSSYGTLSKSCMMDKISYNPNILDIYKKNPDTCQLAVMLNNEGKLVARALVWKIDEIAKFRRGKDEEFYKSLPIEEWVGSKHEYLLISKAKDLYFMDRIYYTKDWMENAFHKWASSNNMMIRWKNEVCYRNLTLDNMPMLSVRVNKIAYRQFPYIDTFCHYDVQESKLSNYRLTNRGFELKNLQGGYTSLGTDIQKTIDKTTNFIRRFKDFKF